MSFKIIAEDIYESQALVQTIKKTASKIEKLGIKIEANVDDVDKAPAVYIAWNSFPGLGENTVLRYLLAQSIAAHIESYQKGKILKRLAAKKFSRWQNEDIENLIRQVLEDKQSFDQKANMRYIQLQLEDYLNQCDLINLKGFSQFRLPAYLHCLENYLTYAANHMLLEREYEEFVALIQDFIRSRKSKLEKIHVVWRDERDFILLDGDKKEMSLHDFDLIDSFGIGFTEEVLLQVLFQAAPKQLILHTGGLREAPKIALVLQSIFAGRSILCAGCPLCAAAADR